MASLGIWQVLVYGKSWYMASLGIWQVLVYGKSWYMASLGIWQVLVYGIGVKLWGLSAMLISESSSPNLPEHLN